MIFSITISRTPPLQITPAALTVPVILHEQSVIAMISVWLTAGQVALAGTLYVNSYKPGASEPTAQVLPAKFPLSGEMLNVPPAVAVDGK